MLVFNCRNIFLYNESYRLQILLKNWKKNMRTLKNGGTRYSVKIIVYNVLSSRL
jgi:hypothetical protein